MRNGEGGGAKRGRGRSTGVNPPRETWSCEEFEVRCFYEIMMSDRPAGQPAQVGSLLWWYNVGISVLLMRPHCLGEECQLYWEEMIHQLAYFHNIIIDSNYRNPIILLLTFWRSGRRETPERLRPQGAEIKVSGAATLLVTPLPDTNRLDNLVAIN